jgi:hypothetical protein
MRNFWGVARFWALKIAGSEAGAGVLGGHDADPIAYGAGGVVEDGGDAAAAGAFEGAEGLAGHGVDEMAGLEVAADPGVEAVILPQKEGAGAGAEGGREAKGGVDEGGAE